MATFTGFDAINRNAPLIDQMPVSCIGIENATVIDGRGGGNAIRLTNGSRFYLPSPDKSAQHFVAAGAAIRINGDVADESIVLGVGMSKALDPASVAIYFGLVIKNGWLTFKHDTQYTVIKQSMKNEWMYIELRFKKTLHSSGARSSIFIDGIEVASAAISAGQGSWFVSAIIAQSSSNLTLDVDDVYFERQQVESSITIPILASGKISCLPLTATCSNEFAITGSNAHSALSDNDDATYISSDVAASAVFDVSNNVSKVVFGINANLRGKTSKNGVVTVAIEQNGVAVCNEQIIGLNSQLNTATLTDLTRSDGTKIWTDILKNGVQIKVTT